jgi:hypothetical protein
MVNWMAMVNLSRADELLQAPIPAAAQTIKAAGGEASRLLLHHLAGEQTRYLFGVWEGFQILLALATAGVLYLATDKRPLPLILCGFMLALVLVQYFAITPELSYRGRETDFPKAAEEGGVRGVTPSNPIPMLTGLFIATEVAKLAAGGYMAAYMFWYRSRRRKRPDDDPEEIAKAAVLRTSVTPQG